MTAKEIRAAERSFSLPLEADPWRDSYGTPPQVVINQALFREPEEPVCPHARRVGENANGQLIYLLPRMVIGHGESGYVPTAVCLDCALDVLGEGSS